MDNYAVIGNPISHSKSPYIHTTFAKQTSQNMVYTAIESPVDGFAETIKAFEAVGGKGCNITLPFKEVAYAIATHHSELAKQSKAANTLVFRENDEIYADSTDGLGLIQDITHNHHYSLHEKNIVIIGAGGVVKCIAGPLLSHAPDRLTIANRTAKKAIAIAEQFKTQGDVIGLDLHDLPKSPCDLIINATSASMTGQIPNITPALIGRRTWCYDLFYRQGPTTFLKWARHHGAEQCIDGLGMLVEQAAMAFYLWRGVYPETKLLIDHYTHRK